MSMNPEDVIKYKSLYLQTSWGYLNILRKNVAFLLRGSNRDESINSAHLASHSLKSQSILMGYDQVGKLSAVMEQIFRGTKENTFVLDNPKLEIIMDILKKVQLSLSQIAETGHEMDMVDEIKTLDELLNK